MLRSMRFATALLPVVALGIACGSTAALEVTGAASDGLVFARPVGVQTDLFRARLRDGAVRPFLASDDREEVWPYWSDAGARLSFQHRALGSDAYDLSLWSAGRSDVQSLTATPARDEQWPAWSPSGDRIVFAHRGGAQPAGLASIDVATRTETSIAHSGARDLFFRPSFAPDGRRIVAQRRDAAGHGSTLWIAEPGASPLRLTQDAGSFEQKPFFTRDGAAVVYTRERGDEPREVVHASSTGAVARLPGSEARADEHSARPSPTRDEVAFVSDRSGTRDIFVVALGGGAAHNLTNTPDRDEFAPRWSPDGERLVITVSPLHPRGREGDRVRPEETRLSIRDRTGRELFETDGMMADWMPAF